MFKKWLIFVLATLITGAVNSWYFFYLYHKPPGHLQLNIFLFSWVLNFTLMGWVVIAASQLKPNLSSGYFNSKPFELGGAIYPRLGINLFRKFLVLVGWEKLSRLSNPVKNSAEGLTAFELNTRKSEFGHVVVAIVVLVITAVILILYGVKYILSLMLLNVLLNIYPVMLQRFNRPRLKRLITQRQHLKHL